MLGNCKGAQLIMVNVDGLRSMEARKQLIELQAKLDALTKKGEVRVDEKKNHRPGKPDPNRKYVLLSKRLSSWGNVPQQQADLAELLAKNFEVGEEVTEAQVFNALVDGAGEYDSICKSKQDPTYLFRYYRGIDKKDGKTAGFIKRGFLRVVE